MQIKVRSWCQCMKCEEESISFICSECPVVETLYFTVHPGRSSGALLDLLQPAKVFPLKPNRHQWPTIISQMALPVFPSWNTQLSGPYLIKYSFKMINLNVKLRIFLSSTPAPLHWHLHTFTHSTCCSSATFRAISSLKAWKTFFLKQI